MKQLTIKEFEDNDAAMIAYELAINTNAHIVIDGMSGTGKSELIRCIMAETQKLTLLLECRHEYENNEVEAYFEIPKVWDHLFFSFLMQFKDVKYSEFKEEYLRKVDTIIINRSFWLKPLHLDWINLKLRKVKGNTNPFGGVQMIYVGDFRDMPSNYNTEDFNKRCGFFFEWIDFYTTKPIFIKLEKNYRFKEEKTLAILQSIREGCYDYVDLINDTCYREGKFSIPFCTDVVYITDRPDSVNIEYSSKYDQSLCLGHEIKFNHDIIGIFRSELSFGVGEKVLTAIDDADGNYLCGMLGYIKSISTNIITVRLIGGKVVKVKKVGVLRTGYNIENGAYNLKKIEVKEFPLIKAWAADIYDIEFFRCNIFLSNEILNLHNKGRLYTYFSRIASIERVRFNLPIIEENVFLLTKMKDFLKNFVCECNFKRIEEVLCTI